MTAPASDAPSNAGTAGVRWAYRDRWWVDPYRVTVDDLLAQTAEGSPEAVRTGEPGAPAPGSLPCHTADKCIQPLGGDGENGRSVEGAPTDRPNKEKGNEGEGGEELHDTKPQETSSWVHTAKSIWKKGNGYARTAREIRATMGSFVGRWGLGRLGFMTLTFAGEAPTIKEARRRFRSLRTNALDGRYSSWLCVLQRGKLGRLHFHLVVVCREDIRSGFDFGAVKNRDYRSASAYLREEWAFWREACPRYSFGRSELLPVRTDVERAARYVARYISRHLRARFPEDKRARLVSFADNAREGVGRRRIHVETGGPAERRLSGLIHDLGLSGIGELRARLGRSWRRKLARLLDPDEITDKDFWRIVHAMRACVEGKVPLEHALQDSIAAVTTEPAEWQAEF